MTDAEKSSLKAVLSLLNESKELHEYGDFKAHKVAEQARLQLIAIIEKKGGADGSKSTT